MLYSVPFYQAADGRFKGVISAIIRSNVFEAALMGVPFVPVTDDDKAKQKTGGWALPQAVRFTLSNEKYGISIQDRRNTDLAKHMQSGVEGRNVFHLPLNIHSDSPWVLTYYLPESLIADELAQSDRTFYALVAVALAVLPWPWSRWCCWAASGGPFRRSGDSWQRCRTETSPSV